MAKQHDAEARSRILNSWQRSGLSCKAFARRAGVSFATLYRWRRAQELEGGKQFIEVVAAESAARGPVHVDQADAALEIALPGGSVIRVGRGADASLVRIVAQSLL